MPFVQLEPSLRSHSQGPQLQPARFLKQATGRKRDQERGSSGKHPAEPRGEETARGPGRWPPLRTRETHVLKTMYPAASVSFGEEGRSCPRFSPEADSIPDLHCFGGACQLCQPPAPGDRHQGRWLPELPVPAPSVPIPWKCHQLAGLVIFLAFPLPLPF